MSDQDSILAPDWDFNLDPELQYGRRIRETVRDRPPHVKLSDARWNGELRRVDAWEQLKDRFDKDVREFTADLYGHDVHAEQPLIAPEDRRKAIVFGAVGGIVVLAFVWILFFGMSAVTP